jgi:hypothetical protein
MEDLTKNGSAFFALFNCCLVRMTLIIVNYGLGFFIVSVIFGNISSITRVIRFLIAIVNGIFTNNNRNVYLVYDSGELVNANIEL